MFCETATSLAQALLHSAIFGRVSLNTVISCFARQQRLWRKLYYPCSTHNKQKDEAKDTKNFNGNTAVGIHRWKSVITALSKQRGVRKKPLGIMKLQQNECIFFNSKRNIEGLHHF